MGSPVPFWAPPFNKCKGSSTQLANILNSLKRPHFIAIILHLTKPEKGEAKYNPRTSSKEVYSVDNWSQRSATRNCNSRAKYFICYRKKKQQQQKNKTKQKNISSTNLNNLENTII